VSERELAVQHRERLKRMMDDKNAFLDKLKEERRSLYLVSPSAGETRFLRQSQMPGPATFRLVDS
jgi:hypothetical protein